MKLAPLSFAAMIAVGGCAVKAVPLHDLNTGPAARISPPNDVDEQDDQIREPPDHEIDNPEVRAAKISKPIHALPDLEMARLDLQFLEENKIGLDQELLTCNAILTRTPGDAKAARDLAYLNQMIPRFETAIKSAMEGLAESTVDWEEKTPPSERARQRIWEKTYNAFRQQGFEDDEAKSEADKLSGPMPPEPK